MAQYQSQCFFFFLAGICDDEVVPLLLVELKLWYGCGLDRVSFFR